MSTQGQEICDNLKVHIQHTNSDVSNITNYGTGGLVKFENVTFDNNNPLFGQGSLRMGQNSFGALDWRDVQFAQYEDFTIDFWFYKDQNVAGKHEAILGNNSGGGGAANWRILYNHQTNEGIKFIHNQSSQLLNSGPVPLGQWNHLAIERFNNNLYMYLNGVIVSTEIGISKAIYAFGVSGSNAWGPLGYSTEASFREDFPSSITDLGYFPGTLTSYTGFDGYIQDFRIINGVSAYSGTNFGSSLLKTRYGIEFDGSGDYIEPYKTGPFNLSGDFTISFWANKHDHNTGGGWSQRMFSIGNISSATTYESSGDWLAVMGSSSQLIIDTYNKGSGDVSVVKGILTSSRQVQHSQALPLNEWYHIALVRSGVNNKLYLDGECVLEYNESSKASISGPLYIGSLVHTNGNHYGEFDGLIQDFRVTKTADYTADFTPIRQLSSTSGAEMLIQGSRLDGTYTGDGSASGYTVNLGYRPSRVTVRAVGGTYNGYMTIKDGDPIVGAKRYYSGSTSYTITQSDVTNKTGHIEITDTGIIFYGNGNDSVFNVSGTSYEYEAELIEDKSDNQSLDIVGDARVVVDSIVVDDSSGSLLSICGLLQQTITFTLQGSANVGESITLNGTSSAGLAVSYTSSNTSVATISGTTLSIVGSGSVTITASQSGDDTYSAADSVTQSLSASQLTQAITFTLQGSANVGESITLNGTSSAGLAVSYTSSNTSVATISGETLSIVGGGSVTITASQSGNNTYSPADSVTQSLSASKQSQSIVFTFPSGLEEGDVIALNGVSTSGLAISYASSNPGVISISGVFATIISTGSAVVTASQSGNNEYEPAEDVSQIVGISNPSFDGLSNASLIYASMLENMEPSWENVYGNLAITGALAGFNTIINHCIENNLTQDISDALSLDLGDITLNYLGDNFTINYRPDDTGIIQTGGYNYTGMNFKVVSDTSNNDLFNQSIYFNIDESRQNPVRMFMIDSGDHNVYQIREVEPL